MLLPELPDVGAGGRAARTRLRAHSSSPTNGEPVEVDGLQVMIQSLTSPTDGPIGDSSLWVYDGRQRVLNQNDARPS